MNLGPTSAVSGLVPVITPQNVESAGDDDGTAAEDCQGRDVTEKGVAEGDPPKEFGIVEWRQEGDLCRVEKP